MRRATRKRQSLFLLSCAVLGLAPQVVVGAPTKITDLTPAGIPTGVAFNAANNRVYVTNGNFGTFTGVVRNSVTVVDAVTNTIVGAPIPVGLNPRGVAVDATTNRIYVANGDGTLSVLDGATNAVMATVAVGAGPSAVAVNASSRRVYVTNQTGNSVSVVNADTNAAIDSDGDAANGVTAIPVGAAPIGVAVNSATNRVYATSSTQGTVTVINGGDNSVKTTILVGNGSNNNSVRGVAVNETTNLIYAVGLIGSGSLRSAFAVIDGATDTLSTKIELISTTSTTAPNPSRVAVDALSNRIYIQQVILAEGVAVYDGADNRLIGSVAVNPAPDIRRFYVTGTNGGALNRLSVFSDLPDNLQFAVANVTVNEGVGSATISVVRVGTPSGAVTVNYATGDGTATAPFDYTSTSGTLSFAGGVTAQSITVPITFNATAEGDESFSLTLTSPRNNGASLGAPST